MTWIQVRHARAENARHRGGVREHADLGPASFRGFIPCHHAIDRLPGDAPWIEADTTRACRPGT